MTLQTCSPTGSSVHVILQERILECVAQPSSRGYSWPEYPICVYYVSCIGRQVFTTSTTWTLVQTLNCFFCQISWITDVSLHQFYPTSILHLYLSFPHRKRILNLDSRQKMLSDPNTVLYLSTGISWLKENSNAMLGGSNFDMNSSE